MVLHIVIKVYLTSSIPRVHDQQHLTIRLIPDELVIEHQILDPILTLHCVDLLLVSQLT